MPEEDSLPAGECGTTFNPLGVDAAAAPPAPSPLADAAAAAAAATSAAAWAGDVVDVDDDDPVDEEVEALDSKVCCESLFKSRSCGRMRKTSMRMRPEREP